MAITNAMIIGQATEQLAAAGIIGQDEMIHTFATWKQLGFSVRKGEHAVCKLTIWKCVSGKRSVDEEDADDEKRMIMKTAHFFALHQVDRLPA